MTWPTIVSLRFLVVTGLVLLAACLAGCDDCEDGDTGLDCSSVSVSEMQCGQEMSCSSGVVRATWHEHGSCGGSESIVDFGCTYVCPNGCNADAEPYPSSGNLAAHFCQP